MRKNILLMLLVFRTVIYAQVGVGTLAPNESAILDVVANNKGVLIPRVPLKGTTDSTTISNGNVESLLVYNTELIADVKPGYYYWFKDKWNKIVSTDDALSIAKVLSTADNGLVVNAGNVKLGGLLTAATTLTTTATATLALSGLQQTTTEAKDNVVVVDATTGVLKVIPRANFVSAITTKNSGYTALATDETILVDATVASVTITLPSAALSLGKKFTIKKIDSSDNNVNITSVSGTIDTVATVSGGVWLQSWTVQSDGSNWFIINS
jgi:hypothetical protein